LEFALRQKANGDFENWHYGSWYYEPDNWMSNNYVQWTCGIDERDSDAYHGNFSIKLINYDSSSACQAYAISKFPIPTHPFNLIAFQKCILADSDTVSIKVTLLNSGIEIDSGYWINTSSVLTFTQVTIPITQNSSLTDSAIIEIRGGSRLITNQFGNGTQFWIDYLFFDSVSNSEVASIKNKYLKIFPNPTTGNLFINFPKQDNFNASIKIFDALGKEINFDLKSKIDSYQSNIDLSFLEDGFYYLLFQTELQNEIAKFVINKKSNKK
jgi:hypothetical protein